MRLEARHITFINGHLQIPLMGKNKVDRVNILNPNILKSLVKKRSLDKRWFHFEEKKLISLRKTNSKSILKSNNYFV